MRTPPVSMKRASNGKLPPKSPARSAIRAGLYLGGRASGSLRHRPMSANAQAPGTTQVHGGRIVAQRLAANGVSKLFTLSGGHLFSIYDGCREEGIDLVDVRHEQAAAFAAEGWAKATRTPGVCALTA